MSDSVLSNILNAMPILLIKTKTGLVTEAIVTPLNFPTWGDIPKEKARGLAAKSGQTHPLSFCRLPWLKDPIITEQVAWEPKEQEFLYFVWAKVILQE